MWLLRARWTVVIDLNLIDSFSMVVNIVLQVTESWPMTWDQSVKRCIPLLPVCRERAKTQVLAVLLQFRVKRRLNGKGSFWNTLYATPRVRALWTVITNTVRTKESVRVFFVVLLISGCFTKRPCLNFNVDHVSIACLQSEIDTGESSCYVRKSWVSKFTLVGTEQVSFHVGCLFLYGCL